MIINAINTIAKYNNNLSSMQFCIGKKNKKLAVSFYVFQLLRARLH